MDNVKAVDIKNALMDILYLRLNSSLSNCRGHCYDGCSTMEGATAGVATAIKEMEPRALYTHCYAHALNVVCGDSLKRSKVMKDALDTTYEITKLVKLSQKRNAAYRHIQVT